MSDDGETSGLELVLLVLLLGLGVTFLIQPATATLGEVADFLDMFPDPETLGPYGSIIAAIAALSGVGGLLRNKFG